MKIVNGILFKLNWIACVVGGAIWGAFGIAALLGFSVYAGSWRRDLPLVLGLGIVGALLDTLWIMLGVLDYGTVVAPLWIIMLWIGLALTLNHAMSFFASRPVVGAVLSGGAAPVTYLSGQSLGAVVVPDVYLLGVIALTWGLLFYAVFKYLQSIAPELMEETSADQPTPQIQQEQRPKEEQSHAY